jgi:hypothetical protein
MRNRISNSLLLASLAVSLGLSRGLTQDTSAAQSASTPASATTGSESVKLPYGVEDVLKLSRAHVSDEVITTYIQNSGTIYGLEPKDIVYLKEQGVSDRIINTMMDQRRIANEVAAQAQQQQQVAAQQAAMFAQNDNPVTTPAYSEAEPAVAAVTQPASTLYVIPYPTPSYPRYSASFCYPYAYSSPYTYSCYSFGRPVVGFRVGAVRSFHSFHHHR